jgi:catechol 2,3-dioxygenase-like lactoylglutathione lyase family enzyme
MPAELTGILQVAIPVRDIRRASHFYREVLGFRFLFEGPNMAFFDCAGVRLYLDANQGPAQPGDNTLLYFRTSAMEQQAALFQERNVTIFREPHVIASMPHQDIWLMWIRDSEENLLGIMEERKK